MLPLHSPLCLWKLADKLLSWVATGVERLQKCTVHALIVTLSSNLHTQLCNNKQWILLFLISVAKQDVGDEDADLADSNSIVNIKRWEKHDNY